MKMKKTRGIIYLQLILSTFFLTVLDQWTKHLAVTHLQNQSDISLIDGVLSISFYPLSWTVARSTRILYSRLYRPLDWMIVWMPCPINSPAVNSSVWQSPVHWRQLPLLFWQMNPPVIWIPKPVRMY